MTDVVSVKFTKRGKSYYFDPQGIQVAPGDKVIVETAKGLDMGECAVGNHQVDDSCIVNPLRPVIRLTTEDDLRIIEDNKRLEQEAFVICKEKIAQHQLDMKLVDVECSFESNKILFFFTSDGRVDFRELVKDLASVFRTRIELRQIGVRDEAKMMGGLGICGRPYCCNQFLNDFEPVSTKMAKTQSMSLNPTKISGSCGRLMCCLRYEQEAYEELIKNVPKVGSFVQTVGGYGNVVQTDVLRQKVKVRLDMEGETEVKTYDAVQVAAVPGGRPNPGEPLPQVLNYVEPEPGIDTSDEDSWHAPDLFAEPMTPTDGAHGDAPGQAKPHKKGGQRRHRGPGNRGQNNKEQKSPGAQPQKEAQGSQMKAQVKVQNKNQNKPSGKNQNKPHNKPQGKPQAQKTDEAQGEAKAQNRRRRPNRRKDGAPPQNKNQ